MNTNPYETPRESSDRVTRRYLNPASWLVPWLLILFVSYVIAALLTPADPFSSLLGAIPVFVAMVVARWLGVLAGRREAEQRLAEEHREDG